MAYTNQKFDRAIREVVDAALEALFDDGSLTPDEYLGPDDEPVGAAWAALEEAAAEYPDLIYYVDVAELYYSAIDAGYLDTIKAAEAEAEAGIDDLSGGDGLHGIIAAVIIRALVIAARDRYRDALMWERRDYHTPGGGADD